MHIIDNFLNTEDFTWCHQNIDELFKYSGLAYLWWDEKQQTDETIFKFVKMVHQEYNPLKLDMNKIKGFEAWTNILAEKDESWKHPMFTCPEGSTHYPNSTGQWHVDDDTDNRHETSKVVIAPISSVFYLDTNCEGGYLELTDIKDTDNIIDGDQKSINDYAINNPAKIERIACIPNRLIIFDPSRYHRMATVTKGFRKAITMNIWDKFPNSAKTGFSPMNYNFDVTEVDGWTLNKERR